MDVNNIQNISKFSNSVFIIKSNNILGTGFFVKLSIPSEYEPMYGLMTCNHILGSECLIQDFEFSIMYNNEEKEFKIKLDKSYFMFTSKLLDVTFIQFNENTINKLNLSKNDFLTSCSNNNILNENIYVFQYLDGSCKLDKGNFIYDKSINNFNYYYYTTSTDMGLSGSPLINNNLEVIGIHKGKNDFSKDDNEHVATKINIIDYAICTLYKRNDKIKIDQSKDLPKELSDDEINELEKHGLQRIQIKNSDKFFMTSKFYSSSILYFYRTNHAWYWTDHINEANDNVNKN
ncbi:hypothetical protein PIROE2DRAFT_15779, partial [Piromyces sp. E2]